MKDETYRKKKQEAAEYDLLETCQCCFAEGLIPEECYFCQKGCVFCFECVKRGAETAIGSGNLKFPCYSNCQAEFSLQILQVNVFFFFSSDIYEFVLFCCWWAFNICQHIQSCSRPMTPNIIAKLFQFRTSIFVAKKLKTR